MSVEREPDRRLHPVSLLFNLGAHLKDLVIPLVASVFIAPTDRFRLIAPVVITALASGFAVFKYLSYSYRYDEDDLVVRTGLFFRNERHVPYTRIQNIDAVQNVVHRLFNVAVVQVQTGSSAEPEATLSVLPMSELADMRRRVLVERRATAIESEVAPPAPTRLLHLSPRELLLAGFIENRGMALVLAAMGALSQMDLLEGVIDRMMPDDRPPWLERALPDGALPPATSIILVVGTMLLAALIFVRILSTVWTVIRLHDFTLVRDGNDLRAEYGLFTRVAATIPIQRVQTISVHQRWLHRRFGRAAIRVTTAGASGIPGEGKTTADREWLAPIIPVSAVRSLIHEVDPSLELSGISWTPAHPRAATRIMGVSAIWVAAVTVALAFLIGWWSLLIGGALVAWAMFRARGLATNLGAAILLGDRVAFRAGWLHRVVSIARFERIQSASWHQTFFDRRTAMARVAVDTPGMGHSGLSMAYLPEAVALRMHSELALAAARAPFIW